MTKDELVTLIRDHKDYEGHVDEFELADILLAAGESEGMEKDAERWRMLPAFLEDHQINYVKLLRDIDAAIAKEPK
jgi:hypothetical protein